MARELSVRMEGAKELTRQLERLSGELAGKALLQSVRAGARVVANDAKSRVARDSGDLHRAIRVQTTAKRFGFAEVVVRAWSKKAWYAHLVEFGTRSHAVNLRRSKGKKVMTDGKAFYGKTVSHPGTAARPFMRPAFDTNRERIVSTITTGLQARIARVLKQRGSR